MFRVPDCNTLHTSKSLLLTTTRQRVIMVSELLPGDPERVGPYRLVGRLGVGGTGVVYLAQSQGGRPLAVKVIHPSLADGTASRSLFGREINATRKVNGLYTAGLVDSDPHGSLAWFATAYVPGPSLAQAVDLHGPLPARSVTALAAGRPTSPNG
jgi:serine/threonine protein kinase